MGFDDIFERKHSHHGNYQERYHDDHRYSHDSHHSSHGHDAHLNLLNILGKIRGNKKLKLFIVLAGIVILAIVVTLIIVLFPLITKLFNYIGQNGLQGVLDSVTSFLDKIWKGTGN